MCRILFTGNRNASSWAFRAWLALKEQNIEINRKMLADIAVHDAAAFTAVLKAAKVAK